MPRTSLLTKHTLFFFFAAAVAFDTNARAQEPRPEPAKSKPISSLWTPNARKPTLDDVTKITGVYLQNATAEQPKIPNTWILELGGDPVRLNELVPLVVSDYSREHVEVRLLTTVKADKPGKVVVVLKGGKARKELSKGDFTEHDLSELKRKDPQSEEKWRGGELTNLSLCLWVYKFTGGVLPNDLGIPDLTEAEFADSVENSKPSEWILYRSKENLEADPALNPQQRQAMWAAQQKELDRLAERSLRLHGLITVRKTTTDAKFFGKVLYERLAAGSWHGKPVVLLYWGGPDPKLRERWGPFNALQEGTSYAEDVEKQVLYCLNLDKLLEQQDKPKANPK